MYRIELNSLTCLLYTSAVGGLEHGKRVVQAARREIAERHGIRGGEDLVEAVDKAAAIAGFQPREPVPVSYTHLDVYKRQVYGLVLWVLSLL